MNKTKYLYLAICVFLIVFSTLMAATIYHNRVVTKMQHEIDTKQDTINNMQTEIEELEVSRAELKCSYLLLQEEYENLEIQADEFAAEILELKQLISKYEEAEKEAKVVQETKKQSLASSKPVKEEITTETKTETKTYNKSSLSDSEVYMLAQLIYLEGGNTSYECQLAIGSVVLNLMRSDGVSLKTEIYTPGRFSVASSVAYTTPSETSLKAARYLANNGTTLPSNVKCFRNNHYFSWCTPYTHIDNVYFGSY